MRTLADLFDTSPAATLATALARLAETGVRRIAIYGAGRHTAGAAAALLRPPVEIVGIIDDDASRHGADLAGHAIISRRAAMDAGVQTVVLSSDAAEDLLWDRSADLRAAGITVVRLHAPRPIADGQHLLLYPAFDDPQQLADHWRRLAWYLAPMLADLREVIIPVARRGMRPGAGPQFLEPALDHLSPALARRVRWLEAPAPDTLRTVAPASQAVLMWDSAADGGSSRAVTIPAPGLPRIYHVDHRRDRRADTAYLHLSDDLNPERDADSAASRRRFSALLASRRWGDVGYVFGTGPSLSDAAAEHDFSDGTAIVCNSMVRNRALMARLRPPIITVADPIFHAGPSRYAAEFRRHLVDVMREHGSWLIVPRRDERIYRTHLPGDLRDRIVGIPLISADAPTLDLRSSFTASATSNIFTLFMLPLACTLFREIRIMGCDGRPAAENSYFWKHAPANQLPERMDDARLAHPSFFAISYDDYYATHCATLATWLDAGEAMGKRFVNLTPSHIPALAARSSTLLAREALAA